MYRNDRNLQRHFPIDDSLLRSGDIHDQVAKLSEIASKKMMYLGRQILEDVFPRVARGVGAFVNVRYSLACAKFATTANFGGLCGCFFGNVRDKTSNIRLSGDMLPLVCL